MTRLDWYELEEKYQAGLAVIENQIDSLLEGAALGRGYSDRYEADHLTEDFMAGAIASAMVLSPLAAVLTSGMLGYRAWVMSNFDYIALRSLESASFATLTMTSYFVYFLPAALLVSVAKEHHRKAALYSSEEMAKFKGQVVIFDEMNIIRMALKSRGYDPKKFTYKSRRRPNSKTTDFLILDDDKCLASFR